MNNGKRLASSRYITGFDGLRTVAVIGVILYHLMPFTFTGGYLGVPIFFVVSGYLITDLLIQEWEQNHQIKLGAFYIRRMKRLYPGLVAMLFATSAYITLFQQNLLQNIHRIIGSNLVYLYNWWQIANGQSYFDRFANNESPFTHLWSLSIEGQYYFIWPVIVILLLMFVKDKHRIFNILFVFACASALWMGFLYQPNVDPSRIYYGTDTRLFSILLGSGLAFVWPSTALKQRIQRTQRIVLDIAGAVSVVGIVWLIFRLDSESAMLYRGGMLLFSLFAMVLVAVVAHPGADWNRLFTNPVFKWIGKRSYGIYLYQFPVMIFFESKFTNIAQHPILYPLIEVAIILGLSHLSYRYLELPLQHFDYTKIFRFIKQLFNPHYKMGYQRWLTCGLSVLFVVGLVGVCLGPSQKTDTANHSALATKIKKNQAKNRAKKAALIEETKKANAASKKAAADSSASASVSAASSQAAESAAQKHPVNQDLEKYGLTQVQLQRAQQLSITAIGDSVMLDGADSLNQIFPKMIVDATVGRQLIQSTSIINAYINKGALANVVLVGLGTNGSFTSDQMDTFMKAIGPDRQVFWVTVFVPTRAWQNSVNATLQQAKSRYANLVLIDWYHYASGHKDWFYEDQVHPNPTGMPYYSTFVAKQLIANIK